MYKWFRRRDKGSMTLIGLGLVLVLLLFSLFVINLGTLYIQNKNVQSKIQRAANSAVEYAMLDDYRADGILRLDLDIAEDSFSSFIEEDLGLNSSGVYYKNGEKIYQVEIDDLDISETPPEITVTGTIELTTPYSLFDREWIVTYEFNITSKNVSLK